MSRCVRIPIFRGGYFYLTGVEVRKATEKIRMCLISPDCGFLFELVGLAQGLALNNLAGA